MGYRYTFFVPAVLQSMHWGFHSCNGLSATTDFSKWGQPHLWKDVLKRHKNHHLHVMVGGGDQIYNDGFWKTAPFQAWLDIPVNKVGKTPIKRIYICMNQQLSIILL